MSKLDFMENRCTQIQCNSCKRLKTIEPQWLSRWGVNAADTDQEIVAKITQGSNQHPCISCHTKSWRVLTVEESLPTPPQSFLMNKTSPLEILKSVFGYDSFRNFQQEIIDVLLEGEDALVLMPTGGGKSLCFQIPALIREGTAIVISPLIALMEDQVVKLKQMGVAAACLHSGMDWEAQHHIRDQAHQLDLLYLSPESMATEKTQEFLSTLNLSLFAIDEAHCISMWGHDFRPDYVQLKNLKTLWPDVPRIAMTATADARTKDDIIDKLHLHDAHVFISNFDRPNITYTIEPKNNAKNQLLNFLNTNHKEDAGIVYCRTRSKSESLAKWLNDNGFKTVAYHAGLGHKERKQAQDHFLYEEGVIACATIAFGMGIDKSNVRFVAHMEIPKNIEAYYQETGRAGRDGLPANAWLCYGPSDTIMLRQWLDESDSSQQQKQIEKERLSKMMIFCETITCRRQQLLSYFGQEHPGNCGNCDACSHHNETYEATDDVLTALSCVRDVDFHYGVQYHLDILMGSENERIVSRHNHLIKAHGQGRGKNRAHWASVYRQLIAQEMLDVDYEHSTLLLSTQGREFLKNPHQLELVVPHIPAKASSSKANAKAKTIKTLDKNFDNPEQEALFDELRDLRLELARKAKVPPYVIFHDSTLIDMAKSCPRNEEEMSFIHGVGETKLKKFSQAFLEIINKSVKT